MRLCVTTALNMQTTIIVYWVYQLTGNVASVGLLGLFEAIPAIGCSLFSGYVVDQREKRKLIIFLITLYVGLALVMIALSYRSLHQFSSDAVVWTIYGAVFVGGVIRAFISPASFALLGALVPRRLLSNAAAWSSTSWQTGAVAGPLLAGLLLSIFSISWALFALLPLYIIALFGAMKLKPTPLLVKTKEPVLDSLKKGFKFLFSTQLLLAVLALDMFAVLLGGATALLPAFADKILASQDGLMRLLHITLSSKLIFGLLRAAPGIGALIMLGILSFVPLKTNPGKKLLFCIAIYGITIIVFGLSGSFFLSFAMLLIGGMADAVSVVIRGSLLQLYTPNDMRGRIAAVNTMFISSSNELGEVESGFTAHLLGLRPAVLLGGSLTLVVVVTTWFAAPRLRKLNELKGN